MTKEELRHKTALLVGEVIANGSYGISVKERLIVLSEEYANAKLEALAKEIRNIELLTEEGVKTGTIIRDLADDDIDAALERVKGEK